MKLIFAGTPDFAAEALKSLIDAGFEIALILTQPDRPSGRGMKLQPSAVKKVALKHDIPVAQPTSLKRDGAYAEEAKNAYAELQRVKCDAMVVVAYGLILPQDVLDLPRLGCLNIHASLLPRWRGAAPIQRAIEAGDQETGVTIMQMNAGLDTGDMLQCEAIPIAPEDTAATLHDKLAEMGAKMIVSTLHALDKGDIQAVPQSDDGVNYAAKIMKSEAALDFTLPASDVVRKVHAFNPFPGAIASFNDAPIKILRAELINGEVKGEAGEILCATAQDGIVVACGEGSIRLLELQRAGGKRLPAKEFLAGFDTFSGHFS